MDSNALLQSIQFSNREMHLYTWGHLWLGGVSETEERAAAGECLLPEAHIVTSKCLVLVFL